MLELKMFAQWNGFIDIVHHDWTQNHLAFCVDVFTGVLYILDFNGCFLFVNELSC